MAQFNTSCSSVPDASSELAHLFTSVQARVAALEGNLPDAVHTPEPDFEKRTNYIRTCGTQNKVQWESTDPCVPKKSLPDVLPLGNPPPKPSRPPSVDIHRFRRNRKQSEGEKCCLT